MYNFNIAAHEKTMSRYVPVLLKELKTLGIHRQEDSGDNVVFIKGEHRISFAKHIFYRYSGICKITRDVGKSGVEWVDVTNEMYMVTFVSNLIKKCFTNNK
jgi:hypothetical protein